ncbi:MAG: alpha/beta hydrolase family protein [Myxococcaceae bacterium]
MSVRRPLFLFVTLLLCGCPGPAEKPEPPHLLWSSDAHALENPYPDHRLVQDDGFHARTDWFKEYLPSTAIKAQTVSLLRKWNDSAKIAQGVGNLGLTLIKPSAAIDRSSLTGVAARLVEAEDGFRVLEADVAVEHSLESVDGTGKTADENYPEYLIVRPSVILPEGMNGLLVLKKGLKTADGQELGRGKAFDDAAKSGATKEQVTAAAAALGIDANDILLVLPQHAEMVTEPLKKLAAWTVSAPAPAYTIPPKGVVDNGPVGEWTSTDADWQPLKDQLETHAFARPAQYVARVIVGTYKSHDLRQDGIWNAAWIDDPASSPTVDLNFTLTLPAGSKPAGGYRVAIGGHGLNGRNSVVFNATSAFCLEVGEVLAQVGIGCLGIDAASHGKRGSSIDFFALDDLVKARDNFRQTAFDMMQLSRLAQVLDLDNDGTPDLDGQSLGYFGNSLGGIMGANFLSFDPRVKYGVLNVPGGGLANILTSPVIRDQIGLLLCAKTNLQYQSSDYYAAIPIFRVAGQLLLEQADPINLTQTNDRRPLLIQEGVDDLTIPNLTTNSLAFNMGMPAASTTPVSDPAGLRVFFRMDPKVYLGPVKATGYNGHNIFWETAAAPARHQAATFLQSKGTQFVVE